MLIRNVRRLIPSSRLRSRRQSQRRADGRLSSRRRLYLAWPSTGLQPEMSRRLQHLQHWWVSGVLLPWPLHQLGACVRAHMRYARMVAVNESLDIGDELDDELWHLLFKPRLIVGFIFISWRLNATVCLVSEEWLFIVIWSRWTALS